jgi:hypothetical protein
VEILDPFTLLLKPQRKTRAGAKKAAEQPFMISPAMGLHSGRDDKKPKPGSRVFKVGAFSGNPTREILEGFYSLYLENLRKLPYGMKWASLDEIWPVDAGDWEISDSGIVGSIDVGQTETAPDLPETGTYWPLFVIQETNGYRLRDEGYRVQAYRELAAEGKWNKKLLVVTDKPVGDGTLKRITYTIPAPRILTDGFKIPRFAVYNNKPATAESQDNPYVVPYESEDGYSVAMVWSHLLQFAFFEYGERTGELIKPSPVINDVEAWKKWRGY